MKERKKEAERVGEVRNLINYGLESDKNLLKWHLPNSLFKFTVQ